MDEGIIDDCNGLDTNASRGEFTKVVGYVAGLWLPEDVDTQAKLGQQAVSQMVLQGQDNDESQLGLSEFVNRAEAVVIGGRAFESIMDFPATGTLPDTQSVSDWWKEASAKVIAGGGIQGRQDANGTRMFMAGGNITRGEMIALALQFYRANEVALYADQNGEDLPSTASILALDALEVYNFDVDVSVAFDGSVVTPVGDVSASLASGSPAGKTLAIGTAKAEVLRLRFSGTGTVTSLTMVKTSVANVASIANIYLFNPTTGARITDGFSLNSNGLVTIAGLNLVAPTEVAVVITVAGAGVATSGEEIQLGLQSYNVSGAGEQTASTVITGGTFRLATATIATYTTGPVTPTGGALNAGPDEQVVFQSSVAIAQRDVVFMQLIMEQIGSAPTNAFRDLRLLIDGVEVSTSSGLDENSRVVFSGGTGVNVKQGTRVFQVMAKVVAGAARTFQLSIRNPVDFEMVDPTVGSSIGNTVGGNATVQSAAASNINGGTCTLTKNPSSQTGQLVLTATNVRLASFNVICYGEDVKANQLTASFAYSNVGGNATAALRNGYIAIGMSGDGSKADQVSTTAQQGGNATLLQAGTVYNTNFVFTGGMNYTLEVYADTFDAVGAGFLAGETILVAINTGAANAQLQQSRGTINVPGAPTTASTLTLASAAALATTPSANYPSQFAVFPSTRLKVADFNVSNGNVENVNITGVTIGLAGTLVAMNDLVVVFNGKQAPIQSTVGAGGTFAISDVLKTNTTVNLQVYVSVLGNAANAQTLTTTATVNGTTALSGLAATSGAIGGQTITLAAGTINMTAGPNGVNASILSGNKTIVAFEGDVSTLNDSFTVNGLTINLSAFSTVTAVNIKQGGTLVRTFAPAAATVLTGLEIPAAKNVSSYFTIELVLGDVGTSAGTSGEAIVVTVAAATALNGNGTQVAVALAGTASNSVNIYKDVPVITAQSLPSTLLTAAADKTVAKFKVDGVVGWSDFTMAVNKSIGALAVTGCYVKKVSDNSTIPGTCTSAILAGAAAGTIVFNATLEQTIGASGETYEVHITTTGAPVTGDSLSVTWQNSGLAPAAPAARATVAGTAATFVWSDRSGSPHSLASLDWNNDAFVKNLPISTWNMAL
jgi:hypothetical protein